MDKEMPFHNVGTFLKAPRGDPRQTKGCISKFGVVGIPYDGSTSYAPGQRFGPAAIRDASAMLTDGEHPRFGVDPSRHVSDLGDIITSNDLAASSAAISKWYATSTHVAMRHPVFALGGDHSITFSILSGFARYAIHDPNLRVVVFDAHCDTWENDFGHNRGHGTWVRDAVEAGYVKAENIVQIGIRSPADKETREWLSSRGGKVFGVREAMRDEAPLRAALAAVNESEAPLYVSIDIDALDPSCAPGTGTPEIAGLSTFVMQDILEHQLDYRRLIGADVVEVLPMLDSHNKITALTAATMIWSIMSKRLYQTAE